MRNPILNSIKIAKSAEEPPSQLTFHVKRITKRRYRDVRMSDGKTHDKAILVSRVETSTEKEAEKKGAETSAFQPWGSGRDN